jgi:hypothetical protein
MIRPVRAHRVSKKLKIISLVHGRAGAWQIIVVFEISGGSGGWAVDSPFAG